jgi:hypothetical protein
VKFDFHLRSGKTITLDFPTTDTMQDLVNAMRGMRSDDLLGGSDGVAYLEDIEAVTVHTKITPRTLIPAPRMLIDGDGDVWTEVAPDQWQHPDLAGLHTLAQIKEEFGPLKQEPR